MKSKALSLILNYKKINTYALNVVLGALESNEHLNDIDVYHANGVSELISLIHDSHSKGEKTIVLWSFYSPQFIDATNELNAIKSQIKDDMVINVVGGVHATAEPKRTAAAANPESSPNRPRATKQHPPGRHPGCRRQPQAPR